MKTVISLFVLILFIVVGCARGGAIVTDFEPTNIEKPKKNALTPLFYSSDEEKSEKLKEIINTPHTEHPNLALINEIAKIKAKNLLAKKSNSF